MPEFLELLPPSEALQRMIQHLEPVLQTETVQTSAALSRVSASDITAPHPLPAFARSTVDGFAVRAADTHGASESLPAYLRVAGEVLMGTPAGLSLDSGECALIHTGGMLPAGADAVVMVEHTSTARPGEIEVFKAAAAGENTLEVGEDVSEGAVVIPAGTRLRPAEIGGLMALGVTELEAACRPRVAILSSGDEVVPPEQQPGPGQVRDVNSYSLSALVEAAGGQPVRYGIVPDRAESLEAAARQAMDECDLVVITAGSSASERDLTSAVIARLGSPGVLVHGVNVRPGKPTILGVCAGKAVIGLPGNPVSALVIARLFVVPVVQRLQNLRVGVPEAVVFARLALNLASQAGREDWVPVRLVSRAAGMTAEPVFGKSNLIFTLARADGLVRIPPNATGLEAGQVVEVLIL